MLIYYDNLIRKNFCNCGFLAILYIFLQITIMQKCSFWQNMAKRRRLCEKYALQSIENYAMIFAILRPFSGQLYELLEFGI